MASNRVFIVWAPHSRRSESIALRLKAEIRFFHWKFRKKAYAPLKYPLLAAITFKFLISMRPRIILAQSPPVLCPLICSLYSLLYSAGLIVDAHTGVWDSPWKWLSMLSKWTMKRSLLTLYHDYYASRQLSSWDVKALFLEDKVPELSSKAHRTRGNRLCLVFVSTFAEDEPLDEVLKAARTLPSVEFYITGDISYAKPEHLNSSPDNVIFTDYLPESDYVALLEASDGVIVLTTKDKTELSGCYEALALGKPIITSDTPGLRSAFNMGTVHIDNSAESIVSAINYLAQNRERLTREIALLKKRKNEEWERSFARLAVLCAEAETERA